MKRSYVLATVLCAGALLLAGCAAPDTSAPGEAQEVGTATVAPGTQAHLALLLNSSAAPTEEATVSVVEDGGLDVQAPDTLTANETGDLAGWVGFQIPEDAEDGERTVTLEVSQGDEITLVRFTITVQTPDDTLSQGTVAQVHLAARTAEGALAFTTEERLDASALPRAQGYQTPQAFQPIPLQLAAQSQLPASLIQALINASVDQSMTVEVPDAFGPATIEEEQPREETVPRTSEEQRFLEAPRQLAAQQGLIDETSQEGDPVDLGSGLPYVIDHLNETTVRIGIDVSEGENVTRYPAWTEATEVVEVSNETVTLRTTPTTEEGAAFTWNEQWPEATEVVGVTEEEITLRHTPEEGLTYTQMDQQGQEVTLTVENVGDETITVAQENPHPLGGQTLFFEVTVLEEQEAPQQPTMGQP